MSKLKFTLDPETKTLSEKDSKRYFSIFGFAAFLLMVMSYVSHYAIGFLLAHFAPQLLQNAIVNELASILSLYGIAFPIFYLVLRRLPRGVPAASEMGAKNWWKGLCIAFAFMTAGSYVSNFIISIFDSLMGESLINPVQTMTEGRSFWVNLIFVAVVAPILEELLFRKVTCDRLLPLGEGYAIILSAVLFGLVHGNFFQFFYAAGVGLLFALVYVKTGKIRYTVVYHCLINLMGGVIAPWIMERVSPFMTEEGIARLMEMLENDPLAMMSVWQLYLLPLMLYEGVFLAATICGIIFFIRGIKKLRVTEGLLPPAKEGRVANVFCNVGVAAALTVFAVLFLLSLI